MDLLFDIVYMYIEREEEEDRPNEHPHRLYVFIPVPRFFVLSYDTNAASGRDIDSRPIAYHTRATLIDITR